MRDVLLEIKEYIDGGNYLPQDLIDKVFKALDRKDSDGWLFPKETPPKIATPYNVQYKGTDGKPKVSTGFFMLPHNYWQVDGVFKIQPSEIVCYRPMPLPYVKNEVKDKIAKYLLDCGFSSLVQRDGRLLLFDKDRIVLEEDATEGGGLSGTLLNALKTSIKSDLSNLSYGLNGQGGVSGSYDVGSIDLTNHLEKKFDLIFLLLNN